jgi:hypothetical protein
MKILEQFMESSIAVTEQIALMMQENTRLKQRVTELEELKLPKPEPEPDVQTQTQ